MDELNLYDDLDEFQEQQDKKSKELQEVEEKYNNALKTIEELKTEKKSLNKKIQRIELSFQCLLDTARGEIQRKDKEIERLRKEKDDICFRRRKPPQRARDTDTQDYSEEPAPQQVFHNPFRSVTTEETVNSYTPQEEGLAVVKKSIDKELSSEHSPDFHFTESNKHYRSREYERPQDYNKKPKNDKEIGKDISKTYKYEKEIEKDISKTYKYENRDPRARHKDQKEKDHEVRGHNKDYKEKDHSSREKYRDVRESNHDYKDKDQKSRDHNKHLNNKERYYDYESRHKESSHRRDHSRNRSETDRSRGRDNKDKKYTKSSESPERSRDRDRSNHSNKHEESSRSHCQKKSSQSPERNSKNRDGYSSRDRYRSSEHHSKERNRNKSRDRKHTDQSCNKSSKSPERNDSKMERSQNVPLFHQNPMSENCKVLGKQIPQDLIETSKAVKEEKPLKFIDGIPSDENKSTKSRETNIDPETTDKSKKDEQTLKKSLEKGKTIQEKVIDYNSINPLNECDNATDKNKPSEDFKDLSEKLQEKPTTKLCTPSKVSLYDNLFGPSPTTKTIINTENEKQINEAAIHGETSGKVSLNDELFGPSPTTNTIVNKKDKQSNESEAISIINKENEKQITETDTCGETSAKALLCDELFGPSPNTKTIINTETEKQITETSTHGESSGKVSLSDDLFGPSPTTKTIINKKEKQINESADISNTIINKENEKQINETDTRGETSAKLLLCDELCGPSPTTKTIINTENEKQIIEPTAGEEISREWKDDSNKNTSNLCVTPGDSSNDISVNCSTTKNSTSTSIIESITDMTEDQEFNDNEEESVTKNTEDRKITNCSKSSTTQKLSTPRKIALYNELFGESPANSTATTSCSSTKSLLNNIKGILENTTSTEVISSATTSPGDYTDLSSCLQSPLKNSHKNFDPSEIDKCFIKNNDEPSNRKNIDSVDLTIDDGDDNNIIDEIDFIQIPGLDFPTPSCSNKVKLLKDNLNLYDKLKALEGKCETKNCTEIINYAESFAIPGLNLISVDTKETQHSKDILSEAEIATPTAILEHISDQGIYGENMFNNIENKPLNYEEKIRKKIFGIHLKGQENFLHDSEKSTNIECQTIPGLDLISSLCPQDTEKGKPNEESTETYSDSNSAEKESYKETDIVSAETFSESGEKESNKETDIVNTNDNQNSFKKSKNKVHIIEILTINATLAKDISNTSTDISATVNKSMNEDVIKISKKQMDHSTSSSQESIKNIPKNQQIGDETTITTTIINTDALELSQRSLSQEIDIDDEHSTDMEAVKTTELPKDYTEENLVDEINSDNNCTTSRNMTDLALTETTECEQIIDQPKSFSVSNIFQKQVDQSKSIVIPGLDLVSDPVVETYQKPENVKNIDLIKTGYEDILLKVSDDENSNESLINKTEKGMDASDCNTMPDPMNEKTQAFNNNEEISEPENSKIPSTEQSGIQDDGHVFTSELDSTADHTKVTSQDPENNKDVLDYLTADEEDALIIQSEQGNSNTSSKLESELQIDKSEADSNLKLPTETFEIHENSPEILDSKEEEEISNTSSKKAIISSKVDQSSIPGLDLLSKLTNQTSQDPEKDEDVLIVETELENYNEEKSEEQDDLDENISGSGLASDPTDQANLNILSKVDSKKQEDPAEVVSDLNLVSNTIHNLENYKNNFDSLITDDEDALIIASEQENSSELSSQVSESDKQIRDSVIKYDEEEQNSNSSSAIEQENSSEVFSQVSENYKQVRDPIITDDNEQQNSNSSSASEQENFSEVSSQVSENNKQIRDSVIKDDEEEQHSNTSSKVEYEVEVDHSKHVSKPILNSVTDDKEEKNSNTSSKLECEIEVATPVSDLASDPIKEAYQYPENDKEVLNALAANSNTSSKVVSKKQVVEIVSDLRLVTGTSQEPKNGKEILDLLEEEISDTSSKMVSEIQVDSSSLPVLNVVSDHTKETSQNSENNKEILDLLATDDVSNEENNSNTSSKVESEIQVYKSGADSDLNLISEISQVPENDQEILDSTIDDEVALIKHKNHDNSTKLNIEKQIDNSSLLGLDLLSDLTKETSQNSENDKEIINSSTTDNEIIYSLEVEHSNTSSKIPVSNLTKETSQKSENYHEILDSTTDEEVALINHKNNETSTKLEFEKQIDNSSLLGLDLVSNLTKESAQNPENDKEILGSVTTDDEIIYSLEEEHSNTSSKIPVSNLTKETSQKSENDKETIDSSTTDDEDALIILSEQENSNTSSKVVDKAEVDSDLNQILETSQLPNNDPEILVSLEEGEISNTSSKMDFEIQVDNYSMSVSDLTKVTFQDPVIDKEILDSLTTDGEDALIIPIEQENSNMSSRVESEMQLDKIQVDCDLELVSETSQVLKNYPEILDSLEEGEISNTSSKMECEIQVDNYSMSVSDLTKATSQDPEVDKEILDSLTTDDEDALIISSEQENSNTSSKLESENQADKSEASTHLNLISKTFQVLKNDQEILDSFEEEIISNTSSKIESQIQVDNSSMNDLDLVSQLPIETSKYRQNEKDILDALTTDDEDALIISSEQENSNTSSQVGPEKQTDKPEVCADLNLTEEEESPSKIEAEIQVDSARKPSLDLVSEITKETCEYPENDKEMINYLTTDDINAFTISSEQENSNISSKKESEIQVDKSGVDSDLNSLTEISEVLQNDTEIIGSIENSNISSKEESEIQVDKVGDDSDLNLISETSKKDKEIVGSIDHTKETSQDSKEVNKDHKSQEIADEDVMIKANDDEKSVNLKLRSEKQLDIFDDITDLTETVSLDTEIGKVCNDFTEKDEIIVQNLSVVDVVSSEFLQEVAEKQVVEHESLTDITEILAENSETETFSKVSEIGKVALNTAAQNLKAADEFSLHSNLNLSTQIEESHCLQIGSHDKLPINESEKQQDSGQAKQKIFQDFDADNKIIDPTEQNSEDVETKNLTDESVGQEVHEFDLNLSQSENVRSPNKYESNSSESNLEIPQNPDENVKETSNIFSSCNETLNERTGKDVEESSQVLEESNILNNAQIIESDENMQNDSNKDIKNQTFVSKTLNSHSSEQNSENFAIVLVDASDTKETEDVNIHEPSVVEDKTDESNVEIESNQLLKEPVMLKSRDENIDIVTTATTSIQNEETETNSTNTSLESSEKIKPRNMFENVNVTNTTSIQNEKVTEIDKSLKSTDMDSSSLENSNILSNILQEATQVSAVSVRNSNTLEEDTQLSKVLSKESNFCSLKDLNDLRESQNNVTIESPEHNKDLEIISMKETGKVIKNFDYDEENPGSSTSMEVTTKEPSVYFLKEPSEMAECQNTLESTATIESLLNKDEIKTTSLMAPERGNLPQVSEKDVEHRGLLSEIKNNGDRLQKEQSAKEISSEMTDSQNTLQSTVTPATFLHKVVPKISSSTEITEEDVQHISLSNENILIPSEMAESQNSLESIATIATSLPKVVPKIHPSTASKSCEITLHVAEEDVQHRSLSNENVITHSEMPESQNTLENTATIAASLPKVVPKTNSSTASKSCEIILQVAEEDVQPISLSNENILILSEMPEYQSDLESLATIAFSLPKVVPKADSSIANKSCEITLQVAEENVQHKSSLNKITLTPNEMPKSHNTLASTATIEASLPTVPKTTTIGDQKITESSNTIPDSYIDVNNPDISTDKNELVKPGNLATNIKYPHTNEAQYSTENSDKEQELLGNEATELLKPALTSPKFKISKAKHNLSTQFPTDTTEMALDLTKSTEILNSSNENTTLESTDNTQKPSMAKVELCFKKLDQFEDKSNLKQQNANKSLQEDNTEFLLTKNSDSLTETVTLESLDNTQKSSIEKVGLCFNKLDQLEVKSNLKQKSPYKTLEADNSELLLAKNPDSLTEIPTLESSDDTIKPTIEKLRLCFNKLEQVEDKLNLKQINPNKTLKTYNNEMLLIENTEIPAKEMEINRNTNLRLCRNDEPTTSSASIITPKTHKNELLLMENPEISAKEFETNSNINLNLHKDDEPTTSSSRLINMQDAAAKKPLKIFVITPKGNLKYLNDRKNMENCKTLTANQNFENKNHKSQSVKQDKTPVQINLPTQNEKKHKNKSMESTNQIKKSPNSNLLMAEIPENTNNANLRLSENAESTANNSNLVNEMVTAPKKPLKVYVTTPKGNLKLLNDKKSIENLKKIKLSIDSESTGKNTMPKTQMSGITTAISTNIYKPHVEGSVALPDIYSVSPSRLPSISTTSPTPANFSGIFSKKSVDITVEDEILKNLKKSPHFMNTKPREYIIPAASVLCNMDNLEIATNANKKLHWELLENKNELTEIEDDSDIENTDEERNQAIEDERVRYNMPEPPPRLTPYKCTESITSDSETLSENETCYRSKTSLNLETNKQKSMQQRQKDMVPITYAVSYFKQLEELEVQQNRERVKLVKKGVKKQLIFATNKVRKPHKKSKHKLPKNIKTKLKTPAAIKVRNLESLMDDNFKPFSIVLPKRQRGRPRKLENFIKAKLNKRTVKMKQTKDITQAGKEIRKRGRPKKIRVNEAEIIENFEPELQETQEIKLDISEEQMQQRGEHQGENQHQLEIDEQIADQNSDNKNSEIKETQNQDNEEYSTNRNEEYQIEKEESLHFGIDDQVNEERKQDTEYYQTEYEKQLEIDEQVIGTTYEEKKQNTDDEHQTEYENQHQLEFHDHVIDDNNSDNSLIAKINKQFYEDQQIYQEFLLNSPNKDDETTKTNEKYNEETQREQQRDHQKDQLINKGDQATLQNDDTSKSNKSALEDHQIYQEFLTNCSEPTEEGGKNLCKDDQTLKEISSEISDIATSQECVMGNKKSCASTFYNSEELEGNKVKKVPVESHKTVESQKEDRVNDKEDSLDESSEPECNTYFCNNDIAGTSKESKLLETENHRRDEEFPTTSQVSKDIYRQSSQTDSQQAVRTDKVQQPLIHRKLINYSKNNEDETERPRPLSNAKVRRLDRSLRGQKPEPKIVIANEKKKIISLEEIGIKVRPFKGHLSSFRIPKMNKDVEATKDKSWKLETYSEGSNENKSKHDYAQNCDKDKRNILKEKEIKSKITKEKDADLKEKKAEKKELYQHKEKREEEKTLQQLKEKVTETVKEEKNKKSDSQVDYYSQRSKDNNQNSNPFPIDPRVTTTRERRKSISHKRKLFSPELYDEDSQPNPTETAKDSNGEVDKNLMNNEKLQEIALEWTNKNSNSSWDKDSCSNSNKEDKSKKTNSIKSRRNLTISQRKHLDGNSEEGNSKRIENNNYNKTKENQCVEEQMQKIFSTENSKTTNADDSEAIKEESNIKDKNLHAEKQHNMNNIKDNNLESSIEDINHNKTRRKSVNLQRRILDSNSSDEETLNEIRAKEMYAKLLKQKQIPKDDNINKNSEDTNPEIKPIQSLRMRKKSLIVQNSLASTNTETEELWKIKESANISTKTIGNNSDAEQQISLHKNHCNIEMDDTSSCSKPITSLKMRRKSMYHESVTAPEPTSSADNNQLENIQGIEYANTLFKTSIRMRRKSMYQERVTSNIHAEESDEISIPKSLDKNLKESIKCNKNMEEATNTPPIKSLKMRRKSVYQESVTTNTSDEELDKKYGGYRNAANAEASTLSTKNSLKIRRKSLYQESTSTNIQQEEKTNRNPSTDPHNSSDKNQHEVICPNSGREDNTKPIIKSLKIRRKSVYQEKVNSNFNQQEEWERVSNEQKRSENIADKDGGSSDKNPLEVSNSSKEKEVAKPPPLKSIKIRRKSMYQEKVSQTEEILEANQQHKSLDKYLPQVNNSSKEKETLKPTKVRRKSMFQERVDQTQEKTSQVSETQNKTDKNQQEIIKYNDEGEAKTPLSNKSKKMGRKSVYQENVTSNIQQEDNLHSLDINQSEAMSESSIERAATNTTLLGLGKNPSEVNSNSESERKVTNAKPIKSIKMRRKSVYQEKNTANMSQEDSDQKQAEVMSNPSSDRSATNTPPLDLDKNQVEVKNSDKESIYVKSPTAKIRRKSMYQERYISNKQQRPQDITNTSDKVQIISSLPQEESDKHDVAAQLSLDKKQAEVMSNSSSDRSATNTPILSLDKNQMEVKNSDKESIDIKSPPAKIRRKSMNQERYLSNKQQIPPELTTNTSDKVQSNTTNCLNENLSLELHHSTDITPTIDSNKSNQNDSESSIIMTHRKSIKMRRKSTNPSRALDTSSDDYEPINATAATTQTVISAEKISTPLTANKIKSRKRRVVKVLSTSTEEPNINITQNSALTPPLISPTLGHPIFNTEVMQQQTLLSTSNQQYDDKFQEIDSQLHEIFQSPQYMADYKSATSTQILNNSSTSHISANVNESTNITIDETIDLGQEHKQGSVDVTQLNESALNETSLAHNQSEVKHLSLGSSEYRFEKISDNVVNLFISRKRKRKRNN